MNYVMSALMILNKNQTCTIKARGKVIAHAVDVAEILTKKFFPDARYKEIKLGTENVINDQGKNTNISSIEIVISPK